MPEEEEEVERDESGTIFESRVQRLVQKADNLRFKPSPDVGDTIIKLSEFFQNIYLQWHDLVGIWITQSHKATFPAPVLSSKCLMPFLEFKKTGVENASLFLRTKEDGT